MSSIKNFKTKTKLRSINYDNDAKESGTIFYPDGRMYKGGIEDGLCSGYGLLYNEQNRLVYQGEWKYNRMNGYGRYDFRNGDRYMGQIKDGYAHGKGIFTIIGTTFIDMTYDKFGPFPVKLD